MAGSNLMAAIRSGQITDVISALEQGDNVNEPDLHGHAGVPLRTACFEGYLDIVRLLIERGADINAPGYEGPGMPLRLAVRGKQTAVIELLLAMGAEVPPGLHLGAIKPPSPAPSIPEQFGLEYSPPEIPPLPWHNTLQHEIESIELEGCYGVDTNVLTADMLRLAEAEELTNKVEPATSNRKFAFWKNGTNR